jgi:asparagine synthase (glutamine-hydrolysing)
MPGIVGLIDSNIPREQAQLHLGEMLRVMQHESFYKVGTLDVPEHGCYLGWVTHPNSYADSNPIVSTKRDLILVFSGEHFSNDGCQTASDLLTLYEQKGQSFLRDINGWFAGVLIDRRERTVLLFNDRFGMERIYFNDRTGSFAFASEAKALLAVRPETRELDPAAVGQFVAFGSVFGDRTLFSNISLLPGGSAWSFQGPAVKKSRFFTPGEWENQPALDDEAVYTALKATLSTAVPSYFGGCNPVAVSLTGGLDTRMIMAGRPSAAQPLPCYTYGGIYRKCFDIDVARQVARACGQPHRVLPLGDDFFVNFGDYADQTVWLTDGCLDLCGAHEVYFSRAARQIAPVRITGNYGSEIVRSVSTFKPSPISQTLFTPDFQLVIEQTLTSFDDVRRGHALSTAAFKEIPWHLHGRLAAARSQLVVRSPFMDNRIVSLMYQATDDFRRKNDAVLRFIADTNPTLAAIETDMGYVGHRSHTTSSWRSFYRYLLFKAEWYYNAGMPVWFSRFDRNPVMRSLEPLFLGSHKIEHYRRWFSDRLFDYTQSVLTDNTSATRPYLDSRGYRDLVQNHESGIGNNMNEITRLITLELVQRLLIKGSYVASESRHRASKPLDVAFQPVLTM